ncbi:MAG: hypothetical protein M1829_003873 [Trizodia sp. TS-e1964]|nr:MAG: hypothetical protein M1829_003873 [Trizodia sp. TS-e1964]
MHYSKALAALAVVASVPSVTAHRHVLEIHHRAQIFLGWFSWIKNQSIQWSVKKDVDYYEPVFSSSYQTDDIICHTGASPAPIHMTVAAGESLSMFWGTWIVGHQGPVIDYMANCNGPCESVNKDDLKFFKVGGVGLLSSKGSGPYGNRGTWAADQLQDNNATWTMTIPPTIAPGNYIVRHEVIAHHNSYLLGGAQNFISCINVKVTGSGIANPPGIPAKEFYHQEDKNIHFSIWADHSTYDIPGPTLWSGATPPLQTGAFKMPDGNPIPNPPGYNGNSAPANATPADSTSPTGTGSASSGPTTSPTGANGPDNIGGMDMGPSAPSGGNKALDSTSGTSTTVDAVSGGPTTVSTSTTKPPCTKKTHSSTCTSSHTTSTTSTSGNYRRHAREVAPQYEA